MTMGRPNSDGGKQAVAWLATTAMFVLGLTICSTIVVVHARQNELPRELGVMIALFLLAAWLIGVIRPRTEQGIAWSELWLWLRSRNDGDEEFVVARRNPYRGPYGTNSAPSAQQIRDLKEGGFSTAWVGRAARTMGGDSSPPKTDTTPDA